MASCLICALNDSEWIYLRGCLLHTFGFSVCLSHCLSLSLCLWFLLCFIVWHIGLCIFCPVFYHTCDLSLCVWFVLFLSCHLSLSVYVLSHVLSHVLPLPVSLSFIPCFIVWFVIVYVCVWSCVLSYVVSLSLRFVLCFIVCYVAVQDFTVFGGSLSMAHARKICKVDFYFCTYVQFLLADLMSLSSSNSSSGVAA